jgi:hypothetical protein
MLLFVELEGELGCEWCPEAEESASGADSFELNPSFREEEGGDEEEKVAAEANTTLSP